MTLADAERLASKTPQEIANHVYANRLGNGGPQSGDGWAYRGSGYLQLTSKSNYKARGAEIGRPLVAEPDLVRRPRDGLLSALAYWGASSSTAKIYSNDGVFRPASGLSAQSGRLMAILAC